MIPVRALPCLSSQRLTKVSQNKKIMELELLNSYFDNKCVWLYMQMGELHSRLLAALDEATIKNQSQQSIDDNEGFISVFMRALKSDTSQGSDFDRNAEEGKLVSYLKQTCELMSKIVRVSMHFTSNGTLT